MATMTTRRRKLKEVTDICKEPGNGDANEYMRGMANGLILALHIMDDAEGDPPYLHGKMISE